jgi:UDP-N-acetylenolpyruvoylglucosamine reductase
VLEDYAHHPTEVRALLGSLRERVAEGSGRLIVVFQPHRFSRTARFLAEFAAALALGDRVHLLDVYPAGESPVPGGTTADLAAAMVRAVRPIPVRHHPGEAAGLFAALRRETLPGDLVVFVGAGDVDRLARAWVAQGGAGRPPAAWDEMAAALRPLLSAGVVLRREEPLAPLTTLRVGGSARLYAEPACVEDVQLLVRAARDRGVPHQILGRGSNLIVPDEGFDGLVLAFCSPAWERCEILEGGRMAVGAGLRLKSLCGAAARAGLSGFEFLEGIPGSVGGALRMNAGAMGGWIFDVVDQVEVLGEDGEVRTLLRDRMHFGYRHCAELERGTALGAVLRSRPGAAADPGGIGRQMDVYRRKRHESQPREPSAGCIFKNPPGDSAGRLIDEAGLKGERIGDAGVSPVHANFIVNLGGATGADVLRLVRLVRERVRASRGITLEPEVLLCGRDWSDVL